MRFKKKNNNEKSYYIIEKILLPWKKERVEKAWLT
jgi:hypothetical protein